jgi:hypothetical protein
MNDFTKEELIVLQGTFKGGCKAFSNYEFDAALELKLQSLIDNYCEHLPESVSFSTCPVGADMKYQCKKCGEFY